MLTAGKLIHPPPRRPGSCRTELPGRPRPFAARTGGGEKDRIQPPPPPLGTAFCTASPCTPPLPIAPPYPEAAAAAGQGRGR